MLDDIRGMIVFARVVENGSFAAAARKLNVSRAAISHSISQMEARLNVKLLHRSTRSLSLTAGVDNAFDRYPTRWDTTRAAPFPQLGFTHCWETCPFGINGRTMYARATYAF